MEWHFTVTGQSLCWIIATAIYVVFLLCVLLWPREKHYTSGSGFGDAIGGAVEGMMGCGIILVGSLFYAVFWIVYLICTR